MVVSRRHVGTGIARKQKKTGARVRATYATAARKQKKTGARVRKIYGALKSM